MEIELADPASCCCDPNIALLINIPVAGIGSCGRPSASGEFVIVKPAVPVYVKAKPARLCIFVTANLSVPVVVTPDVFPLLGFVRQFSFLNTIVEPGGYIREPH